MPGLWRASRSTPAESLARASKSLTVPPPEQAANKDLAQSSGFTNSHRFKKN